MDKIVLDIQNLCVETEGKQILKGLSLTIREGETHAIMGPNGAGKSTLAKVLAGHPAYEITEGTISFQGKDVLEMEPEERAHLGMFVGFQYPLEIPGVSNREFLFSALNAQRKGKELPPLTQAEFDLLLEEHMKAMGIAPEFKTRNINEGFSGGEKKKNEILQMALFSPELSILDETDSGLDIDAIRVVAKGVNQMKSKTKGLVLITHYYRLLEYIRPDFVHVLSGGSIVRSGGVELALELEEKGYA